MNLSTEKLDIILDALHTANTTLIELVCTLISLPINSPLGLARAQRHTLCSPDGLNQIMAAFLSASDTRQTTLHIARTLSTHQYLGEISRLLPKSAGFHFNISHATEERFNEFSSLRMAKTFEQTCPALWGLFGSLLNTVTAFRASNEAIKNGDYLTEVTYCPPFDCARPSKSAKKVNLERNVVIPTPEDMPEADLGYSSIEFDSSDEEEILRNLNESHAVGPESEASAGQAMEDQLIQSNEATKQAEIVKGAPWRKETTSARMHEARRTLIRQITLFSICILNSNMQCNALAAVVGLFVHSTNTPNKVIEMLAHAGLCISPSSIDLMVTRLSADAQKKLKDVLPGLLNMVAIDNLEIFLQTEQPTLTHNGRLESVATATSIPMHPEVQKEDLKLVEQLWAHSPLNQDRSSDSTFVPLTHDTLLRLGAEAFHPPEDPASLESLLAWHIRDILLNPNVTSISDELKAKFRKEKLGAPVAQSQIPILKMVQRPFRTVHTSLSTASGTSSALDQVLRQGGANDRDLETHVLLVHADLGLGEKICALQTSRRIEATHRDRLQFVLFIPGWFHIMMHMADSLWRLYIEPGRPRSNQACSIYSIFYICTILRPREIGKLASKPGFRRTHNVIEHVLLATIIDAWRLAVQKKHQLELSNWKPTWDEIVELSKVVVREYVASNLYRVCGGSRTQNGDQVKDQLRLFNRDALLYMAIRRASRTGDIRRMEELLIPWVYIWTETGKHKYAAHISRFLTNLKYNWPTKLAEIVRNHWLVNPTGKSDGFRGTDWVVERNNYMHKCLYSGGSSNHTIGRLIKQSPLILVYQHSHSIIEKQFYLTQRTLRHPPPLMKHTLARVQHHLSEHEMNSHHVGRKLPEAPKNAIADGVTTLASRVGELWFSPLDMDNDEEMASEVEAELEMTAGDIGVDE